MVNDVSRYTPITYKEFCGAYKNLKLSNQVLHCDYCTIQLNSESYYIQEAGARGAFCFCSENCFNIYVLQVTFRYV